MEKELKEIVEHKRFFPKKELVIPILDESLVKGDYKDEEIKSLKERIDLLEKKLNKKI